MTGYRSVGQHACLATTLDPDEVSDWRDPFLFTEAGATYMVFGGNTTRQRRGGGGQVQLYRATNDELTEWKHLGPVFECRDREVINIECPNLFKLDGRWVLIVSPHKPCEYFIGSLDTHSNTCCGSRYPRRLHGTGYRSPLGFATSVPLDATMGIQINANSTFDWSGNYNGNTNLFDATTFHVLFRYYPDSSELTQLDEGEVALYQSCNYQGKATVFAANTPDFSALTSSDTTLDKTARSIRLGNNTAVTLYSEAEYTGTSQLLTADTECLDSLPIASGTRAIKLQPLVDVALATKSCEGCQLAGVNFTKYDLNGINFSGAALPQATFNGATLTGTILNDANLSGAVLEGAVFSGTQLQKTVLDKASGMKGIDLSNNVVATGVSLQGVDLTGAILNGAQLNCAVLTGATLAGIKTANTNLQQATLSGALGLEGVNLSQAQLQGAVFHGTNLSQVMLPPVMDNADLSGATLTGIKFQNISVNQVIFDGATGLAGADLSLVDFSNTSMRNMNLSGAQFYGAFLNGADLEGSNLSSAYFTNKPGANIPSAAKLAGAHLKNVNLSSANLDGATFTDASFYGTVPALQGTCNVDSDGFTESCATATGATLNGANFGSAYLYGVDFSHSHILGVNFGNAVLVGANFSKANLTSGGQGSDTGFTSAFLQGANLADAVLTGTSLQNAFLDFRPGGNSMYLNLDGTHTTFPNWKTPGKRACVFVYYTVPSAVPVSNTTITCPDGGPGGIKGCGRTSKANTRWASKTDISQTDPPASYLNDATYTNAAPAICSEIAPW